MRVHKGFGKRGIICSAVFVRGILLPRPAMYLHGTRRSTLDSVRTYVLTVLCRKTRVKRSTGDCQPLLSAGDSAVCPEKDTMRPVIGPLLLPGCLGISRAMRHVLMHVTFPFSRFALSSVLELEVGASYRGRLRYSVLYCVYARTVLDGSCFCAIVRSVVGRERAESHGFQAQRKRLSASRRFSCSVCRGCLEKPSRYFRFITPELRDSPSRT